MASTDLGGSYTIMDVVNDYTSLDAKGQYIWAAKVLAKKCPFIQDMPMIASNQIMSNIGVRESYLPTPGTRRFNEGVSPTASHSTPFSDPIAMVEDYSEVDWALWKIQNNPNAWRQSKDAAKVEAMGQKMEDLIVYGSIATDPGAFNGLATRFNSTTTRPNSSTTDPYNVVSANGSGSDTTSLYVVEWGDNKVYGVYPKNLPAGLQIADLGQHTKNTNTEAAPKYLEVLRSHFTWYMGLVVEDERCVQRMVNIEGSGTDNNLNLSTLVQLINQLPSMGDASNTVIYCNRALKTQFDILALDKNNATFTQDSTGDVFGRRVTRFQGIPVRVAEMIDDTETAI